MNKFLELFIRIWMALCTILVLISTASVWWFEGWAKAVWAFSPFNVINYLITLVLVSPALLASWWLVKRLPK